MLFRSLRVTINNAETSKGWLEEIFLLCQANMPAAENISAVLAIDTPLGFSEEFSRLVNRLGCEKYIGQSDTNPYLFRKTEQFLFDHGLKPLSPVKDMIGSQATKGMHVLAKFTPILGQCGVWSDGGTLTAIEAYPSPCKHSNFFQSLLTRYVVGECIEPPGRLWLNQIDNQDMVDALTCALIGHSFKFHPEALAHPPNFIPMEEGWIWVPKDALQSDVRRNVLID